MLQAPGRSGRTPSFGSRSQRVCPPRAFRGCDTGPSGSPSGLLFGEERRRNATGAVRRPTARAPGSVACHRPRPRSRNSFRDHGAIRRAAVTRILRIVAFASQLGLTTGGHRRISSPLPALVWADSGAILSPTEVGARLAGHRRTRTRPSRSFEGASDGKLGPCAAEPVSDSWSERNRSGDSRGYVSFGFRLPGRWLPGTGTLFGARAPGKPRVVCLLESRNRPWYSGCLLGPAPSGDGPESSSLPGGPELILSRSPDSFGGAGPYRQPNPRFGRECAFGRRCGHLVSLFGDTG